ncbi:MAG: NAD(P)/FAD-dependent oxidoreductase [Pseudomonadales bacterium]|nr:NAD(P)/FAD-dependent oxidoreductase [Pseudomonadales bacterium]
MKNLVIIGGGFAGSTLAQQLERHLPAEWEIYLLSETNFVTYHPLLPEVVGASVLPGHVQAPLRHLVKRTRIRMVKVDRVDLQQKTVYYHNNEPGELAYEQLVFAAGVRANTTMIAGMQEHALPLKTVGDALYIRNRVIERLEQATIHPDADHRKHLTTFIIIGGGFSGVETAGELDDFLQAAVGYYKNVQKEDCRVILLHGSDHLLPELSEKLGKKTELLFRKRHIDVRLNTRAVKIESDRVVLANDEVIAAGTIICTIGSTPHRFIQNDELPLERGRIRVAGDMSVPGREGVWALGDCALVPNAMDGRASPPTAQFADRQARFLARNIVAWTRGLPTKPFSYRPLGLLASTGHNKAVAEIFGFCISGFIGFLLWRGTYLLKVPTLARKVRLYLEWNWAMFFPPDIAHLGFKRTEPDEPPLS